MFKLVFSPFGEVVASTGPSSIRFWGVSTGAIAKSIPALGITDLALSPNGLQLAFSGTRNTIEFLSVTGKSRHRTHRFSSRVGGGFQFSPDGRVLASGHRDGQIRVWDRRTATLLAEWAGHKGRVYALAFSPNSRFFVTGSADKRIRFWTTNGKLLLDVAAHSHNVNSVAFSPNGRLLASGSRDKSVKIWKVKVD